LAREVPLPGTRTVTVPESLGSDVRPGSNELFALAEERFAFLDAHRLAVIDAEAGRVLGTRVLDETVERRPWSFSTDRAGRFVGFGRYDLHVCVWDLDLDSVDCTPGVEGIVSPNGRSVFLSADDGGLVRLDRSNARRHRSRRHPRDSGSRSRPSHRASAGSSRRAARARGPMEAHAVACGCSTRRLVPRSARSRTRSFPAIRFALRAERGLLGPAERSSSATRSRARFGAGSRWPRSHTACTGRRTGVA
jgi:hypothetical protein